MTSTVVLNGWNLGSRTTARTWAEGVLRAEFEGKVFGAEDAEEEN
jgi:hypothetical protein